MTGKKEEIIKSRRNFLRKGAVVGTGVVVASGLPGVAVASTAVKAEESPTEEGYRLTKHIRDYYKTAAS